MKPLTKAKTGYVTDDRRSSSANEECAKEKPPDKVTQSHAVVSASVSSCVVGVDVGVGAGDGFREVKHKRDHRCPKDNTKTPVYHTNMYQILSDKSVTDDGDDSATIVAETPHQVVDVVTKKNSVQQPEVAEQVN